jgi:murein DD-endopeptidase
MRIKWNAVMANEQREFEAMSEAEKFVYFMLLQYRSPYGWGNETLEKSDCSGAVCLALYAATGLLVRVTADDLSRKVFTAPVLSKSDRNIAAAFWYDAGGRAVHVCACLGGGAVLNSEEGGARVKSLDAVNAWFKKRGYRMEVKALDRGRLERLAGEGAVFGLDDGFWKDFER